MLDQLLGAADQAGRAVLQIGQAIFIFISDGKIIGIVARQHGIAIAHQGQGTSAQRCNICLGRARCPTAQQSQRIGGLFRGGGHVGICKVDVHS